MTQHEQSGAGPAQLLHQIERLARREPVVFLSGAFVVGLLGARFFRSGGPPRPAHGAAAGPAPQAAPLISDEAAARLLREAEQAQRALVSEG